MVVSLAPLYADEGYIPFFPDFLEPDGIGFRGPASIIGGSCWTSHSDCVSHKPGMPFSAGTSVVRSSPITIEYRKNYFFEKLFYLQSLFDYGQLLEIVILVQILKRKEIELTIQQVFYFRILSWVNI